MTLECRIDAATLRCVVCGASVVSPHARKNCGGSPPPAPVLEDGKDFSFTVQSTGGPGTELSALLKRFGINPTPTCQCRAKAQQMDAWGADECEKPERIDEVVAVMRQEAAARGLPFLDAAGRMLVRRAIHNARREASRATQAQAQTASQSGGDSPP